MLSPAATRPFAERLSTVLALVTGCSAEARKLTGQIAADVPADATLESCPTPLLARAVREAARRMPPAGPLGPAERLALILSRGAMLSDDRAAEVAGLTVEEYRAHVASAERNLAASPQRRAVILEDHGLTREMLIDLSRTAGLEIVAATDKGGVAAAAAAAFSPAIAIIDIELDGAELAGDLAAMQIREAAPDCHVLFVTGYPGAGRMAELLSNASALIKPFRAADFTAAVRGVL